MDNGKCTKAPNRKFQIKKIFFFIFQIASLNTARNGISVAVYENAIFAIGGLIGANRSNIVERYTEDEGKWTQIESLNEPRFKCAVFVTGK